MNTDTNIFKVKRSVGLTQCPAGYNDLSPINAERQARWWEVCEDFSAQSFRPYPAVSSDCPAWSPAYRAVDDTGREREFSDLMVLDFHSCSADDTFKWMAQNNLAGLVHSTRSALLMGTRSRIILLLHRPVNDLTYRLLWTRLAREMFSSLKTPAAHADFRQRYDQPRAVRGQSTLQRHDGNLLHVDGALAEPILVGDVLGIVCQAYAGEIWPESMIPRNR